MSTSVRAIVEALRHRFAELYGDRLVAMVLYGSQARGDAEPGSDIDVLVVLEAPVDAGLEIARTGGIVADLSLEHDQVLSCVFLDDQRFRTWNGPLLRNVRREGIAV